MRGGHLAAKKLTAKQSRFVDEYLVDLNATQAAIRAGYSKKTSRSIGPENLSKPVIQEALQKRYDSAIRSGKIATPEEVLEGYTRDIRFDPRKLYNKDGSLKKITELDDETALALQGVEIVNGPEGTTTHKVKMPDRRQNRDSLSKYHGLFEKDNEQKRPEIVIAENIPPEKQAALNKAYQKVLGGK